MTNYYKDNYNTKLDPDEEKKYQNWLQSMSKNTGRDFSNADQSYDMRGYYAATGGQQVQGEQHFPDTYKKPNHPTFSDESIYHSDETPGGHWSGNDDTGWTFKASEWNTLNMKPEELKYYFKSQEPDSNLELPK